MKPEELSVLLIEDDNIEMGSIMRVLESNGIKNIDTASNDFQAIRQIRERVYHLIVSDTMDQNNYPYGPDVVSRAKYLGKNPVVVGLSNYSGSAELWKGLADYFFEKHRFYAGVKQVLKEKFEI